LNKFLLKISQDLFYRVGKNWTTSERW